VATGSDGKILGPHSTGVSLELRMSRNGHLPWFAFYPHDFLSDSKVAVMSALEVGAYIRLLCFAWNETPPGTLPAQNRLLARWGGVTDEEWSEHKEFVMSAFTLKEDGRWHQKRMEAEAIESVEKHRARVEAGRKGGLSKAVAMLEHGSTIHNHNHSHSKKNTPTPQGAGFFPDELRTEAFGKAWSEWEADRKERRKRITPRARELQLEHCRLMGEQRAIAAIRHSIEQGYTGIYEVKLSNKHKPENQNKRTGLL
jgi:uncharacterized protein YdaU (DUF1376 family)